MNEDNILNRFELYRKSDLTVESDLRFWESFLKISIIEYKKKDLLHEELYTSIFPAYDIDPTTNKWLLKTHKEPYSIKTLDLQKHSNEFFIWVMNLAILKSYNNLEMFVLRAIQLKYFPLDSDPLKNKKSFETLNDKMKKHLKALGISFDTKNNRHVIQFLKSQSNLLKSFFELPIQIDSKVTWEIYFEIFSLLRNVVAHNGSMLSNDTLNEIKSVSSDLFKTYFELKNDVSDFHYLRPNQDQFYNFINFSRTFSANTVKFINNEPDLKFLKMVGPGMQV